MVHRFSANNRIANLESRLSAAGYTIGNLVFQLLTTLKCARRLTPTPCRLRTQPNLRHQHRK